MSFVPMDNIVVTLNIVTLARCVTMRNRACMDPAG